MGIPLFWNLEKNKTVDVAFTPLDANDVYAEALVESNAGNEEQALVTLEGVGLIGALDISPDPLNLGEHYVGCEVDNEITITNVGNQAVTISDISQLGDGFELAVTDALPLTLAASRTHYCRSDIYASPRA